MIPDLGGQSSINLDWLFDVCLERAHRLRSRHWMCPSLLVSIPSALINLNTSEKLGNPRQRHSLMQALYGTENPDTYYTPQIRRQVRNARPSEASLMEYRLKVRRPCSFSVELEMLRFRAGQRKDCIRQVWAKIERLVILQQDR